jgi:NAD(P)-dependent dehydrogenase (short-subunit alcohol dehydrogenase family)
MSVENKVAMITGAGSGIGRASALKLAQAGAKLALSDVNVDGGEETVRMVEAQGGEATFVRCDVSNSNSVKAMIDQIVAHYGGFDIALNNAGVGGEMAAVDRQSEDVWDQVININLKGVWLCMKYEIPQLLNRRGGSIINVASVAGLIGVRGNSIYAASKHGVVGLTKSVALEYAKLGIRVNAICPGFTETPMVSDLVDAVPEMGPRVQNASPMRRLGRVEEIADAVLYLAGDTSSFVNGICLPLDGGLTAM